MRRYDRTHRRDVDGTFMVDVGHGRFSLIDDSDIQRVAALTWLVRSTDGFLYPVTGVNGTRMHRFIVGASPGQLVDHINGSTLDNRRANLRFCTSKQNSWNRGPVGGRRYKGITLLPCGLWQVQISHKYLGAFPTEEAAARAYDAAAIALYGDYARLNFPERRAAA